MYADELIFVKSELISYCLTSKHQKRGFRASFLIHFISYIYNFNTHMLFDRKSVLFGIISLFLNEWNLFPTVASVWLFLYNYKIPLLFGKKSILLNISFVWMDLPSQKKGISYVCTSFYFRPVSKFSWLFYNGTFCPYLLSLSASISENMVS